MFREDEILDKPELDRPKKLGGVIVALIVLLTFLHLSLLMSVFFGVHVLFWPLVSILIIGGAVFSYYALNEWKSRGRFIGGIAMFNAATVFLLKHFFAEMSDHSVWVLFHLLLWIIVVGYCVMSIIFITKTVKSREV